MAEYKSFIDSIYLAITDTTKDDATKSNFIIDGIQRVMPNSTPKSNKPDNSKISCSSFSNNIVQFVCKLDKNKTTLCNLPGPIVWVIGKDKINKVIEFITTNDTFVKTVWVRFKDDNDKKDITRLLASIEQQEQQNPSKGSECISNIKKFLGRLVDLSRLPLIESRPSSLTSTSSLSSNESGLTSVESRPSSFSSTSSSVESRPSSVESRPSSVESEPSSLNEKRLGIRLPAASLAATRAFNELTPKEKDYNNMWLDKDVYAPDDYRSLYTNLEDSTATTNGGKTRKGKTRKGKTRKGRKGMKGRKGRKGKTRKGKTRKGKTRKGK